MYLALRHRRQSLKDEDNNMRRYCSNIKAVMKTGEKISVAQIDYQEFDEENFQYVISPYWEIIDGLPASVFQGIPGIDMDIRLERYYRVNYIPTFIAERTPSENREEQW